MAGRADPKRLLDSRGSTLDPVQQPPYLAKAGLRLYQVFHELLPLSVVHRVSCVRRSADALAGAPDLGVDVDLSAVTPFVHHMAVDVEDRGGLVTDLLGDLDDRQLLLGDQQRCPV
ncbi:hypothetical protein NBH00_11295 [Paraconexibacter antarcticus]|uniref:Uncharacterized protein n=1 Tax=Paraconexibacter antarcticus TaxID=2949664 RepID=A0ABY5DXL6_9ACTN|nr:hypothetical protein [Paraconexibacter antarcticus]UTI66768.1 hypothetical protein NBH00_11295 [Paraconexibacter antarcticus]